MKINTLFYIIGTVFLCSAKNTHGQINVENIYTEKVDACYLSNNGLHFVTRDSLNTLRRIYDSNHQLICTTPIYFPTNSNWHNKDHIPFITDNLFNSNSSIELCYTMKDINDNWDSTFIIDQSGSVLYRFNGGTASFFKNGTAFKMEIDNVIYSLPGTYPCDPCSNLSSIATPQQGGGDQRISTAFPNPSSSPVNISYHLPVGINTAELIVMDQLGKTIKMYRLGKDFTDIVIETNAFTSGQYLYRILSEGRKIDEGKFTVLH